jgi:hypothetical protein
VRRTLLILLVVAAAGCGSGSSLSAPSSPPAAGILTGHVVSHSGDNPDQRSAAAGVPVGVYRKRVLLSGPLIADPPRPIATTATAADGTYRIEGLAPGRYYVTFGKAVGRWVRMPDGGGATANADVCSDCPLPL